MKNITKTLIAGILATVMQRKDRLRMDGFLVWDMDEITMVLPV